MGPTNARSWHEQDEFWDAFVATIFDSQRRSVTSEEVEDIVRLVGLRPTQTVCDLCCGIGLQREWTFSHRLYSAAELSALLEGCEFGEVQVYGGLAGSAYVEKAERMVLAGRKSISGGLDRMGTGVV